MLPSDTGEKVTSIFSKGFLHETGEALRSLSRLWWTACRSAHAVCEKHCLPVTLPARRNCSVVRTHFMVRLCPDPDEVTGLVFPRRISPLFGRCSRNGG